MFVSKGKAERLTKVRVTESILKVIPLCKLVSPRSSLNLSM